MTAVAHPLRIDTTAVATAAFGLAARRPSIATGLARGM